jgi:hypothetical protein
MGTSLEIREYRRKLIDAFPPLPFDGLVSTHDDCDDGIHLRRELSGKRWDQLSPKVLFHGSIGLPLLEPSALVAFLPAWLLRSMETSNLDDPIVLELTLYFLCPGGEDDGWDEKRIVEMSVSSMPVNETQWLTFCASSLIAKNGGTGDDVLSLA